MAGLEKEQEALSEAGVRVVAISADGEEGARKMKESEELEFPVLYGADLDEMHERLGLYVRQNEKSHLQPTQFILDPDGRVRVASYSSERIGRIQAEEALELIESERG